MEEQTGSRIGEPSAEKPTGKIIPAAVDSMPTADEWQALAEGQQEELAAARDLSEHLKSELVEATRKCSDMEIELQQLRKPRQQPAKLYAKIARVMALVQDIPKRGMNDKFRFSYATDADVFAAIRKPMGDAGLVAIAFQDEPKYSTIATSGGGEMTIARVKVTVHLADSESGEWEDIPWYSEGRDVADKAVAKAVTSALKSCLLKVFLLSAVDEDPDADGNARRQPQRPRGNSPAVPPPGVDATTGEAKWITPAQVNLLHKRLSEAKSNEQEVKDCFHLASIEQIDNQTLDRIFAWLKGGRL